MIVYHGSNIEVSCPDLAHSRSNVDFGVGFYTTPLKEQAANGLIDKNEAIKRLRYEKPNVQLALRSEEAIKKYLVFEGSEKI